MCWQSEKQELVDAPEELLLWHWKLGIGMQRLQSMMQNRIFKDPFGRSQCHPPIIKTKFASTSSCAIPKCQSCELAWAQQRSPKVKKIQSNLNSEGAISCNQLEVGDFVSTDQFACRTPGWLPSCYGRERCNGRFHGGILSGLRIRYLLGPVRPSWVKNILKPGYTTPLALR
jgi:hypothetical protein